MNTATIKDKIWLPALLALCITSLCGQTTREEVYNDIRRTGSVYYAYPEPPQTSTPAPEGYEPFYISHFGRHGSRWMISDSDYLRVIHVMNRADSAGVLTGTGRDVLRRLNIIWQDAEGLGGELTPLGARQHKDIARRMYKNYPQVFRPGRHISARSTVVVRCVLSMAAFCEGLKEIDPTLTITRESGQRFMRYLNFWDDEAKAFRSKENPWYAEYLRFYDDHIHPGRLMKLLFADAGYVDGHIKAKDFMYWLYWIASDLQNVEIDVDLYDIFEKEELFDLWQIHNFSMYVGYGPSAWGREHIMPSLRPLLKNILDSANEAIADSIIAATLRFGHDSNLAPLTAFLELEGCNNIEADPAKFYQAWSTFKISPMAGNVQMVFYRKAGSKDVLVKFLHNEKEVGIPVGSDVEPYYHWEDVERFYYSILSNPQ